MKDIRDYSLLAHNTFGIDAKCKRFLEYSSVEEAQQIVAGLTAADQPLLILGGGSNLLLTGDYEGTVIHSAIKGIEVLDNETLAAAEGENLKNPDFVFLNCGSGEVFDDVVAYAVEHGYHGAENLSIIPGEVGASAVQNIGAYGVEAKDIIYKVEAVEIATGKVVVFDNQDCQYSYRQSRFKHEWKDKYPWTNKHLFVDQSPLYNADKIHTPLLFVHGTADNNVPVGESIQLYTALKLLGRPTAMVLVDGQDHHIIDYEKRLKWQNTIFAWFAKWLQDDGSWWKEMYGEEKM